METFFLVAFLIVAAIFIWRDRHDELWDPIVDVFGTCHRSHRGSVARAIRLIGPSNGTRSWLNGVHVQIDSEGIYLGHPILLRYKGAVLLPWTEVTLLPKGRWALGYSAKFVIPSLDIVVKLPRRFRSELEMNCAKASRG